MPWNPENIFVALLAFASPAQAELINHTYWAYHKKGWTGRNTRWNQECQEKYQ